MTVVENRRVPVRNPRTWVPGPGGYVIAVVITCVAFSVVLTGALVAGSPPQIVAYWPLIAAACCTFGLPVGILGAAVVHVTTRRARAEWVHVLVAGLVTAALVPLWFRTLYGGDFDLGWISLAAGGCGALGRGLARPWIRPR